VRSETSADPAYGRSEPKPVARSSDDVERVAGVRDATFDEARAIALRTRLNLWYVVAL
jgi:hypothetical protein